MLQTLARVIRRTLRSDPGKASTVLMFKCPKAEPLKVPGPAGRWSLDPKAAAGEGSSEPGSRSPSQEVSVV